VANWSAFPHWPLIAQGKNFSHSILMCLPNIHSRNAQWTSGFFKVRHASCYRNGRDKELWPRQQHRLWRGWDKEMCCKSGLESEAISGCGADGKRRECSRWKSSHNVANARHGCTMMPFSRSKRKFRITSFIGPLRVWHPAEAQKEA
jgi:hypothetical protein